MLAYVKDYMDVIVDIRHLLHRNIGDTKKMQINWWNLWMAKVETNIKGVTTTDVIPVM